MSLVQLLSTGPTRGHICTPSLSTLATVNDHSTLDAALGLSHAFDGALVTRVDGDGTFDRRQAA
jgi:hypothetical protein